jgi:hypothetical protein
MKKGILVLFGFVFFNFMDAQIHEIGVFVGGSNYIGDIGSTTYLAPNETAFGFLYKWNKSPRHSWRISYMQSNVTGQDKKADSQLRKDRNYAFTNAIKEGSVGMEFNFQDFNLHEDGPKITPYVYSGISVFTYSELFWVAGKYKEDYKHYSFAIPMTVGVKTRIDQHWILGLEAGARYTFTDNIDGSNPRNKNFESLKFGNLSSNDWFVFTGFTLTYTFGRKPCYCNY